MCEVKKNDTAPMTRAKIKLLHENMKILVWPGE